MICPYCDRAFHESWSEHGGWSVEETEEGGQLESTTCAACSGYIVRVHYWAYEATERVYTRSELIYPRRVPQKPPAEVDSAYAEDYREASLVLADSPKASAALSRRLLQHILRDKAGITRRNLDEEIQAVIDEDSLPSDLAHDLDALRTLGNFAAHPTKSTHSGEVVEVEPGEAEWLLSLLDELLDFYFVRPARGAEKRDELNVKLADAGKPPLKGT